MGPGGHTRCKEPNPLWMIPLSKDSPVATHLPAHLLALQSLEPQGHLLTLTSPLILLYLLGILQRYWESRLLCLPVLSCFPKCPRRRKTQRERGSLSMAWRRYPLG